MADEEQKAKEAQEMFRQKSTTVPARKVVIPDNKRNQSLDSVDDDIGQDSDLKATLKRLFPRFTDDRINPVAQAVMVGRVAPDTILDRIYLTVWSIVDTYEPWDTEMDFWLIVNLVTTAFEIGLDSKGRVDAIELHGAREDEELGKIADYMQAR